MIPCPSNVLVFAGRAARAAVAIAAVCLAAGLMALPARAQTAPAQLPLVNSSTIVKPNILFMIDDSTSMRYECLYLPHVYKALTRSGIAASSMPGINTGCLSTVTYSHGSPANNSLMYDPQRRYLPPINSTGMARAALIQASFLDYQANRGAVTIYLPKKGVDLTNPATDLELASNYDKLEVTGTTFIWNGVPTTLSPQPKPAARTDCLADAGYCTFAEERQNVANWLVYHKTRLLETQAGVGEAFFALPDTFRLGWSTLVANTAEDYGDMTGVQDFGQSRAGFYTWLTYQYAGNPIGTYLKFSLDRAGRYYSRTDNKGPWASKPWLAAGSPEASTDQLSCRRSYTILMTDGYWNDGQTRGVPDAPPLYPASVMKNGVPADIDGTVGAKISHATKAGVSYTYEPHNTADPRNIGKADKVSGAGYAGSLADVALNYWARDLRPDLPNNASAGLPGDPPFWQNMTTYAITLGVDGVMTPAEITNARQGKGNWAEPVMSTASALDDLIHAAHNGGGEYMNVRDSNAFAEKLGNVIKSIAAVPLSEAGVSAASAALVDGATKVVPYYTPNTWWGNLKMMSLNADGTEKALPAWQVVETDANKKPTGKTTIPAFASRNLWVWVDAGRRAVAFNPGNVKGFGLRGANSPTLLSDTATDAMVDYLRGDRSNEGGGKFRQREAVMGDIINSTPVFVRDLANFRYDRLPTSVPGAALYGDYLKAKAMRAEGVVFVGANDGMVHGFREGTASTAGGAEVFGYIPRAVLGKLHNLADINYQHQYMVDGPLAEADAFIQTPDAAGITGAAAWRNLVVGSTGAGAKAVFALNVTSLLNMTGNSVLWEVNSSMTGFEELGHVLAPVQTGIMQDGTWVAIFGNGYYSAARKASLFIVNLATGALVKRIEPVQTADATQNGLGGVRLVLNASQQIMGAYAGDLKGRVWKFDLNSSLPAQWVVGLGGNPLFTAQGASGVAQPITAMPVVVERNDIAEFKPSYMVVAATGKLFDTVDLANTATQAAYGLWDKAKFGDATGTSIVASQLVPVTATPSTSDFYSLTAARPIVWTTDRGWVLNFSQAPGQRAIYPVETLGSLVRVATVAPTEASCTRQYGLAFNFIISPLNGSCKASSTLDVTGDGKIDEQDGAACGYTALADGSDTVLPVVGDMATKIGSGQIVNIQSSSGGRFVRLDVDTPVKTDKASARAWRQIYMRAQ